MAADSQHVADVQIAPSGALFDGSDREDASARDAYLTRRGWAVRANRDRGGVRTLTPRGWMAAHDVERGDSLEDVEPVGFVS